MKLIHTGDIHLGCTPDIGTAWSKERCRDIWRTFENILRLAKEEDVQLVLICGDLFHRQPLLKEIKEINQLLSSEKNIQFVITAGNHDYMIPGSPYYSFKWSGNIHFLSSDKPETVEFPEFNTVVHGFSYYNYELPANKSGEILSGLSCPDDGKKHILMLHGGDDRHLALDYNILKNSGFDYIALAHIHKPRIWDDAPMAFCGSPEPLDRTERGNHGCIVVDLNDTRKICDLRFVPISHSRYVSCKIKITPDTTITSLRKTISRIIEEKGGSNIYTFSLSGTRNPELDIMADDFKDLGRILEIINESIPDYSLEELCARHKGDLLDKYIYTLTNKTASADFLDDSDRNALYYGIDALLKSMDKTGDKR